MRILVNSTLLLIALTCFNDAFAAAKRPVAALKEVVGIVKVQRAESKEMLSVSVGNLLYNGDRLNTRSGSSVALLFIDGSILKIQENSEVTINTQRKGDRKLDTKVDLPRGEIWAKVTRRDSKFEIETPSSVASVKGTEFTVLVDEFGTTNLFVFEGLVEFQNELGRVLVQRNQKSTATKDQPPEEPKKLTKKDKAERQVEEPNWQLDIKKPSGSKAPNQSFELQINALNPETNKIDYQCNTEIVVSSPSSGGSFSLDGEVWSKEIEGRLSNGAVSIMAKSRKDEDLEIVVSGNNCRPGKAIVTIEKTRQQKRKEAETAKAVVSKAGISEVEDMQYKGGNVIGGGATIDEVLAKIENGELEIVGKEVIEGADGEKKIILKLKPISSGSSQGGKGSQ